MILPQSGINFLFWIRAFLDTPRSWIRFGYDLDTFWIRGYNFGYVMDTRTLDTFWIRFGYFLDTPRSWIRFGYVLDTL